MGLETLPASDFGMLTSMLSQPPARRKFKAAVEYDKDSTSVSVWDLAKAFPDGNLVTQVEALLKKGS